LGTAFCSSEIALWKSRTKRFEGSAAYTWSHAIDNGQGSGGFFPVFTSSTGAFAKFVVKAVR